MSTAPLVLPRCYVVVDSSDWFARLLPVGVRCLQLRIKDQPLATVRAEVRRARDLCVAHGAQLIVNDYWQLAIDEGCDFVHLGQEDLDTADRSVLQRAGVRLGISTHDEAELARALALQPDYIALGPVYPTTLKAMRFAPQGLLRITEWRQRLGTMPLVAIGGITAERLAGVFAAGADSAAVVSDITRHADPEARARHWLQLCRS